MMFDTLQETVDRLAATLSCSVALLDPDFLLLVNSRHHGDIDAAQVYVLSERMLDPAFIEVIRGQRGSQQHTAFLLDADSAHGAEYPRLLYPLRTSRTLQGYLCVTLARLLLPAEIALIHETTQVLVHLLERSNESIIDANESVEGDVLTLLSEDATAREDAASEIIGIGMFPQTKSFVSICVHTEANWTNTTGPPPRSVVARVLYRAITAPMIHSYTFVPTSPESFVLIGFSGEPSKEALQLIVQGIVRELAVAAEDAPITGWLGVGGSVASLEDVWQSYDQARIAADIARVKGRDFAFWDEEGVSASALAFLSPPTSAHLTPEIVRRLAKAPGDVIALFEAYFALSGNVVAVAERLHMHRSTVYLRIAKASEHLGIDFDDGDSRFLIQAWLLQQRYWADSAALA